MRLQNSFIACKSQFVTMFNEFSLVDLFREFYLLATAIKMFRHGPGYNADNRIRIKCLFFLAFR